MSDTDLKEKEEAAVDPGAFEKEFGKSFSDDEKAKLDDLSDQVGNGYTHPETKPKGKLSKTKKITGGIVGLSVGGGMLGMIIFAPILKLESFMANINQKAFGYAGGAVEARVGHLMERYMIRHVLSLETCRNNVSVDCKANTGNGMAAGLFTTWRDVKLEEKLLDDYGLKIETNRNPDPANGVHRVEITDARGRSIKLSENDLRSGRFTGGDREFGRDMRKFMRDKTKWYQVMERRSVRKYLARKHGINTWCFMACTGRDNVDSKISSAKTRLKYKFVERFVYPFSGKYGLLLDCVISGKPSTRCSNNAIGDELPRRERLPDADVDDIVGRFEGGNSTTLSKYVIEKMVAKIFGQQAARTASSAIPIVGQVYLAVSIASMVNNFDRFIENDGLSKYAADINASQYLEYYTGMRSSADEIKSSALNLDEVGAVVGEFDGAEQSRVFQSQYNSAVSNSGIFGSKAYAATDPYVCANNKPIPEGELVCNEKKVVRKFAVEEIRDNPIVDTALSVANQYDRCLVGTDDFCALRPSSALDPVLNAINWAIDTISGPAVDALMAGARIIPGVDGVINFLTEKVGDLIGWVFGEVFPLPVRVDSPGREKYDGMVAGSEVVASKFAQGGYVGEEGYGLGGVELSPTEAAEINNDQQQQIAYNKKDYSLFERMTDIENPNSLVSSLAANSPTSSADVFTKLASGFANILQLFGLMGNIFIPNAANAAISNGESAFGITRIGYAMNDPAITQDPELLTPEYCEQAMVAWENSKRENPITGFDEYTTPNPCLLEAAAIEAAGAIFTDN